MRISICAFFLALSVVTATDSLASSECDKTGVTGKKCDLCPQGCSRRTRRQAPGAALCFCYGHSDQCSPQSTYGVQNIWSTFDHGKDGWKAATSRGLTPVDVHSRWSPKYTDMEVISSNSLPIYLYAPDSFLGNKLLSYGQNFSFSLRLDRGVRHPSVSDVILEGSGHRVAASLGDLRSIVPCGQKINYTFRLDEQPSSGWRPHLTPFQFQTLLQNLSAIKIRATFGDSGRGYLDNVKLVSAQRGDGAPAHWVRTCVCPPGYQGDFCQQCSAGHKRRTAAQGAFSPCEPCACGGGDCDPKTGDCYPADETQTCSGGFYWDFWSRSCVPCPCPDGVSCSLAPGLARPQCHTCPIGTTGLRCDQCQEGFYGGAGGWQPCRPCQCNGHIDVRVAGSCDRVSGECLKCVNNTMGSRCQVCLPNFYQHTQGDACRPCDCDRQGAETGQCDDAGRCRCRPGFEGPKCQTSRECPACFDAAKVKVEEMASKVQQLEAQNSQLGGGVNNGNNAGVEAVVNVAEALVGDLENDMKKLADLEKQVQDSLASISRTRLSEEEEVQNMADATGDIKERQRTYLTKADQLQDLLADMKVKLDKAKTGLRSAELPAGDAPSAPNLLSTLAQTATGLADKHQTKATAVESSANQALGDSEKSLALVQNLLNRGLDVKDVIGGVKSTYDGMAARVKGLETRAVPVGDEAKEESKKANDMLEDISKMAKEIPPPLTKQTDAMVDKLELLRKAADGNALGFTALRDDIQRDTGDARDLLERGKNAMKDIDALTGRVDAAHADTKEALQRINSNTNKLDGALDTLQGFDQQIVSNRAKADAAIKRLPAINATIQRAAKNNAETQAVLDAVSADSDGAMTSINRLESLIPGLEGSLRSIPALGNDVGKMSDAANELLARAGDLGADVTDELEDARNLEALNSQVGDAAAGALQNARRARDAAEKMLQDLNSRMANMSRPSTFDPSRIQELEDSMAEARGNIETFLKPRLRDAAEREAAQRRQLAILNGDIDTILWDIANLEDILKTIPPGCFNSPPLEQA
ncbi:laminin subunit gamma-2 [Stigmatopora nigra]